MLDYEEVKRFYANKLAQDIAGRGRMESAFFHTIRYAYERGLADGSADRTLHLEPVAWGCLYDGKPDSDKCFPMPGPDADTVAVAARSWIPRTVQYLYALDPHQGGTHRG